VEVTEAEIEIYRCKVAREKARIKLFGNLMEIEALMLKNKIAKWKVGSIKKLKGEKRNEG